MRAAKFRQAAFVYLHVAVLYEATAYAMWRSGRLPVSRLGPPWLWLILGALIAGAVFVGLYRWQNPWFARLIWVVHAARLPSERQADRAHRLRPIGPPRSTVSLVPRRSRA